MLFYYVWFCFRKITNTVVKRTMIFTDETTDTYAMDQIMSNTYHVLFLISQVSHQFLSWPHGNSHLFHVLLATQQLPRTKRNKLTSCNFMNRYVEKSTLQTSILIRKYRCVLTEGSEDGSLLQYWHFEVCLGFRCNHLTQNRLKTASAKKKALKGEILQQLNLNCRSIPSQESASFIFVSFGFLIRKDEYTERSVDQLTNVSMSISSDSNSPTYSGRPSCVRASPRAGYDSSSLSSDCSSESCVVSMLSAAAGPSVVNVLLKYFRPKIL